MAQQSLEAKEETTRTLHEVETFLLTLVKKAG
jgi:hypothetical protein